MTRWKMLPLAGILFLAGMLGFAGAAGAAKYEITVTNLTQGDLPAPLDRGIVFTPPLIALHKAGMVIFNEGDLASGDLELVAEMGDTSDLKTTLDADPNVAATATAGSAPFGPGQSASVEIEASHRFNRISLVGMQLPTNDGFFALNGVKIPRIKRGESVVLYSPAYDAGTEVNDESCSSIPNPGFPDCASVGATPDANADENFVVHIHSGIHGVGHFDEHGRAWRNPVAKITIRRVK